MEEPDEGVLKEFYEGTTHADEATWQRAIAASVLLGEAELTMGLVDHAVADGVDPNEIAEGALVDSMSAVGRDFKNGEFYVPDVLMSSRALHAALFELRKRMGADASGTSGGTLGRAGKPLVLIGTVAGDLHDIGKNIAGLLLQVNGYPVVDLGIDVVPEAFAAAVRRYRPAVLGLSALLTTTISEMPKVLDALAAEGLRDKVRVYVSGVPVTKEFAESIGADRYCADVKDSLDFVREVEEEGWWRDDG